jgi:copper(I)-binding protein
MMKIITAITIGLLAVLLIAGGCNASSGDIVISNAWVRLAPPGNDVTAAYMLIENNSATDDVLLSVEASVAAVAELHESREVNGVVQMTHLGQIDVPAGARIELQPGGMHIMLIGLTRSLEQGDEVAITLNFANAGPIQIRAQVREG